MLTEESRNNTGEVSQQQSKKSYSYGLQCAAMFCNSKQYIWKEGTKTAKKILFFSFRKNDLDIKEWCRLIKRENNRDGFCVKGSTHLCGTLRNIVSTGHQEDH